MLDITHGKLTPHTKELDALKTDKANRQRVICAHASMEKRTQK